MSARPRSDRAAIIGGFISVAGLLVALVAWLHPFSPDEPTRTEPLEKPAVVTTTTTTQPPTTPATTRSPASDTAGVDKPATPTDCSTIADFADRTACVNQARNDAAQDVIDDFE